MEPYIGSKEQFDNILCCPHKCLVLYNVQENKRTCVDSKSPKPPNAKP